MLSYLVKSNSKYSIQPVEETWFGLEEFADHHLTSPMSPVARLLLTADGSMTRMLEVLTLSTVSMKIERQEVLSADGGISSLLDIPSGEKALARETWLTNGKEPLIYAHSLLFAPEKGEFSLQTLQNTEKPLGRMLHDDSIKTLRSDCRMGLVNSTDISTYLGIPAESNLWGRYYRLSTDRGLGGIIFELFTPALIGM